MIVIVASARYIVLLLLLFCSKINSRVSTKHTPSVETSVGKISDGYIAP